MDQGREAAWEGRADLGVRAHCQRVSAWCSELAGALGLSHRERRLVEQAALYHHLSHLVLADRSRLRLLENLRLYETGASVAVSDEVAQLLRAFSGTEKAADPVTAKLAAMLEICDDFDQFFEAEPMMDFEHEEPSPNPAVETLFSYLQVTSRADVSRVIDRLPVFPRAASEVVKCVSSADAGIRELERVASLDPVLAGLLVQTANSSYYSPRSSIGSIRHAITYIGAEAARKVLLAATFRASFASMRLHQLWNHSLDVAELAERLAVRSGLQLDPSEAFLAGLVHDVGRLAFSIMPPAFLERFYRLTDRGCPAMEVEICLSGLCHGELGAETLAQWKFPSALMEAVRWHHRPDRSPSTLASLLYLAEAASESEEDLPSAIRMQIAFRQTGVDAEALVALNRDHVGYLDALRFAA